MRTPARRPALRTALAALLALVPLALLGCREVRDYKPPAVGQTAEILVVTDTATWNGPVGAALRAELGRETRTLPQPTPLFTLRYQPLTEYFLDTIRRRNGVVFVAPYTDTTAVARFIRARLDSASVSALERGGQGVILRPDLWMQRQLVVYATAPTDSALVGQIRAAGDDLRAAFARLARARTAEAMFDKGRQTDVEEELLEAHGFALNVQHDYVIVQDTAFASPEGLPAQFVRLRRFAGMDSWRDLFVYYEEDPSFRRLHPDSVLALRNRLARAFIRGVDDTTYVTIEDRYPDLRPIEVDSVNFGGRFALETRGTWFLTTEQGRTTGMGGPFVSYAFFDEAARRFYLIDGMIFAPPYTLEEKREFLRQMETIAYTFRTAEAAGRSRS